MFTHIPQDNSNSSTAILQWVNPKMSHSDDNKRTAYKVQHKHSNWVFIISGIETSQSVNEKCSFFEKKTVVSNGMKSLDENYIMVNQNNHINLIYLEM